MKLLREGARPAIADHPPIHSRDRQHFLRRIGEKTFVGGGEIGDGQSCFFGGDPLFARQLQNHTPGDPIQ